MRINTGMMLQQSSQSSLVRRSLNQVLEKLSTGKRINRASDDAAGIAMAKRLESMTRAYKTSGGNISDAMSALQIADGGANQISDILQRQNELAVQASSDTLTDQDREALNAEYQQLNAELGRITDSTQYNTMDLLNGNSPLSDGNGVVQVGAGADPSSQMTLDETDMTSANAGWGGDISTAAGAQSALSQISQAMDNISGQRASLGAQVNRLQSAYSNNSTMEYNTVDSLSRLEDLDYAQGVMDLARDNILSQSALTAQNHFNQISQYTVLGLLQ